MLDAIIIDDEPNGVKSLELLIKKFVPRLRVRAATCDPQEGLDLINKYRPDIVFLDINMPVLNGFELLEKLEYKNFYLIFTTAHSEFGLKALKHNAIDYLLKPIGKNYIVEAVERVERRINEKQQAFDIDRILADLLELRKFKVPLPTAAGIDFISPSEIIYIEANSRFSIVMLSNGKALEVTRPLKEYEIILCRKDLSFIRIQKSFIVNTNYVSRYLKEKGGFVVMQGNKSIPISENKKKEFFSLIDPGGSL